MICLSRCHCPESMMSILVAYRVAKQDHMFDMFGLENHPTAVVYSKDTGRLEHACMLSLLLAQSAVAFAIYSVVVVQGMAMARMVGLMAELYSPDAVNFDFVLCVGAWGKSWPSSPFRILLLLTAESADLMGRRGGASHRTSSIALRGGTDDYGGRW